MNEQNLESAVTGSLLGLAAGDAVGLPFEGVGPRRVARLFGGPGVHHLLPGRGMVSDDTEHAVMVAQSLIECTDDPAQFGRRLARRMRLWFLGLPAGIGLATLRACLKLLLFVPPRRSGVWSAGNGPAMRAPLLGVVFAHDDRLLLEFVAVATCISHRDPKAYHGALAVAHAARCAARGNCAPAEYLESLRALLAEQEAGELLELVAGVVESVTAGENTANYCARTGLQKGVTGYMYHTVPAVLHAWFCHQSDYRAGILSIIRCGGDTDTTAAILGGILGAGCGESGIPAAWLSGILEFPRTVGWMRRLSVQLAGVRATGVPGRAPRLSILGIAVRNLLFTLIVLTHGFRRMLPPY